MDWGYVAGYFDGEGTVEFYDSKSKGAKCKKCGLAWFNTHQPSLLAIRRFIGAGQVRSLGVRGTGKNGPHKESFILLVSRRQDTLRIGKAMLDHCIIKRPALVTMLEHLETKVSDAAPGWGSLALAGVDEVSRLYHDLGLSQTKIAERFGITQSAVKLYMQRHGIPARSRSDANRLIDRSTAAWQERNRKVSETKTAQWADPVWRERQMESMRRK